MPTAAPHPDVSQHQSLIRDAQAMNDHRAVEELELRAVLRPAFWPRHEFQTPIMGLPRVVDLDDEIPF